jgi:adenylosuccinate lyase
MLFLMSSIVANLRVDEQRMLKNVELTEGRGMSEAVMIALTEKGMNRQEAHELLRKLTIKSEVEKRHFRQVLIENRAITERLSKKEIDEALDPKNYLGTALKQVENIVRKTGKERHARGLG